MLETLDGVDSEFQTYWMVLIESR